MENLATWQTLYGLQYCSITLIQTVFAAGTVYLLVAIQSISGPRPAYKDLRFALDQQQAVLSHLREIGKSWQGANNIAGILKNMMHVQLRPLMERKMHSNPSVKEIEAASQETEVDNGTVQAGASLSRSSSKGHLRHYSSLSNTRPRNRRPSALHRPSDSQTHTSVCSPAPSASPTINVFHVNAAGSFGSPAVSLLSHSPSIAPPVALLSHSPSLVPSTSASVSPAIPSYAPPSVAPSFSSTSVAASFSSLSVSATGIASGSNPSQSQPPRTAPIDIKRPRYSYPSEVGSLSFNSESFAFPQRSGQVDVPHHHHTNSSDNFNGSVPSSFTLVGYPGSASNDGRPESFFSPPPIADASPSPHSNAMQLFNNQHQNEYWSGQQQHQQQQQPQQSHAVAAPSHSYTALHSYGVYPIDTYNLPKRTGFILNADEEIMSPAPFFPRCEEMEQGGEFLELPADSGNFMAGASPSSSSALDMGGDVFLMEDQAATPDEQELEGWEQFLDYRWP